MTASRVIRMGAAVLAAGLVGASTLLPLWSMSMRAPQYPKGLYLYAYGTRMAGDLRELNILNHYIGMPALQAPALESAVFPFAIALLAALCLLSPAHVWLRRVAVAAAWIAPVAILADLQWQLHAFGHTLNPTAPIRLEPFTPLVIGPTRMGNFVSTASISSGFACLIGAAVLLTISGRLGRRVELRQRECTPKKAAAVAASIGGAMMLAAAPASAQPNPLQARLDTAAPGSTLVITAGSYDGPIVIRGPLTVIAEPATVIDGHGRGSVVTIEGHDVVFRGFTVRHSGRDVTEEAAGIKVTGDRHRIESNIVEQVYFGIHVGDGANVVIQDNEIRPSVDYGARPGNGINAWRLRDSTVVANRIADARDGIYLSFTERTTVARNQVTRCRYGLHSMYSQDARFEANDVYANLLGAALMMSDRLVFSRNRIRHHRDGAAAYGVLLKDIGRLIAEDNWITANRVGVFAEGVPSDPSQEAVLAGNVIAGNEVGLALQSTAALTFTGNRIAENLADVRALGRQLSPQTRWTRAGRGNWWGQYRGFDADGDGIGDVPHRIDDALDALVRRHPLVQAFLYTPAHLAIEAAARMFPLFRQPPLVIDDRPLMTATAGAATHD